MTDAMRIAIIGGGKMGEAVLSGLLAAHQGCAAAWNADAFTVVNPGSEKRKHLQQAYGVCCVEDSSQLAAADIVVLAVKPQKMDEVLSVVSHLPFASSALFISVAAGLSTARLEQLLPAGARVVRAMPNTPLLIGRGVTTLCAGSLASKEDLELGLAMFACLGASFAVDESLMDATGAINGSGPAYVAALIEALAAAGHRQGLDIQLAEQLAVLTVDGTAELMVQRRQSASQTRVDVCSPGGTTLAALGAMEQGGFSTSIIDGVQAAVDRSKELGA